MSMIPILTAFCLCLQDATPKQDTKTFFEYRDSSKGLTLKIDNGRVQLTAPDDKSGKDQTKTWTADSMEEFKHKYPDIARKYDLDKYAAVSKPESIDQWWQQWTGHLDAEQEERFKKFLGGVPKDTPESRQKLDQWFKERRKLLEDFEHRMHEEALPGVEEYSQSQGPVFGVRVAEVPELLRVHLGLQPHEGLVVGDVQKDSLAEHGGVQVNDVLVKMDEKTITGPSDFRDRISAALKGTKEFVLDVIRAGKHQKLTVHPAHP